MTYTNYTMRSLVESSLLKSQLFFHFVRATNQLRESLDEDIDILILESDRSRWKEFLLNNAELNIYYFRSRSYVDTYYIKYDKYFIQLDIEWSLSWHGVEILKSNKDSKYLEFFDKISKILRPILWGGTVKKKYFNDGPLVLLKDDLNDYDLATIFTDNIITEEYCSDLVKNRLDVIKFLRIRDIKNRSFLNYTSTRFRFILNEISLFVKPIGFIVILPKDNIEPSINLLILGRIPWKEFKPLDVNNFSFRGLRDGVVYYFQSNFLNKILMKFNQKKIFFLKSLGIIIHD
jgi:hypothetical protein